MIRIIVALGLWLGMTGGLWAQKLVPFAPEVDAFIVDFTSRLENTPGISRELPPQFSAIWNSGALEQGDKEVFIRQVNQMVSKKYGMAGEIRRYTELYTAVMTEGAYVKLDKADFMKVTGECIERLNREGLNRYLSALGKYLPMGKPNEVERFFWKASQDSPRLYLRAEKEGDASTPLPVIHFRETDLSVISNNDSSTIYNTSGEYDLLNRVFIGKGGRIDWSKVGLNSEDTYCELKDYRLDFTRTRIEADSVVFFYEDILSKPLLGSFEDANTGFSDTLSAKYPAFASYEGGVVIEELMPNIRYTGGFTLRGVQMFGSGYDEWQPIIPKEGEADDWGGVDESTGYTEKALVRRPAKIEIKRNDSYVMRLLGNSFQMGPNELIGKGLETTIYVTDKDSIYHPGMDLAYNVDSLLVVLKRPKKGPQANIPFTSSYHEFFLYFESIVWDLETDDITFTALIDKENKLSAIESYDYFTMARYGQFRHVMKVNPLGAIYRYSLKNKGRPIFAEDIMNSYKLPQQTAALNSTLPSLEASGYVKYDRETMEITPLPKLYNWVRAARGKKDYDAIQLISKVDSGYHAVMDISSQNLTVEGVPFISLSDSQFVRILPMNNQVEVEKNRSLQFGGTIATGRLNFYSSKEDEPNFQFDYDSFKIICDSVDSIRIVPVRNPPPEYKPTALEKALSKTVFENISGAIYIDDPSNKSGLKDYEQYPVFDSYQQSYVFWSDPNIQNGVYHKDSLYFAVDPFVLDSLSTFDLNGLDFGGKFYSSNIFPDMTQSLSVMDDFTLGFSEISPERGYDIYGRKGKFYDEVILDGSGLHGKGRLEHDGMLIHSDSIIFHFDSVMAQVDSFDLRRGFRKGVYFPEATAENIVYKWYPKRDQVVVSTPDTDEAVDMFGGEAQFFGTLSVTPEGISGDGRIVVGHVEVSSEDIKFNDKDFSTENGQFAIIDTLNPKVYHFIADDVNISYDIWRHESEFEPAGGKKGDMANFPIHKYQTSLKTGKYNRSTMDLNLMGKPGTESFVSVNTPGDSLKFPAVSAYYDITTRNLEVEGVTHLYVADAVITPKDGHVSIEEDTYIKNLEDAVVEADAETKQHRIYDANITVQSKLAYYGQGKYDYIEVEGKPQVITFDKIEVIKGVTTGKGAIDGKENFYLTDRIIFNGDVALNADEKYLTFDGEIKIESENPVFKGEWFTFERAPVNPDSVYIPIPKKITNDDGDILTVGLNYVPELQEFYSNFLQAKDEKSDLDVLTAVGGLTVDRKTKEFRIGPENKIKNRTFKGSTVSFDDVKNTITSKGLLKLPYHFKPRTIDVKTAGSWSENINEDQISTDLLMGIDMKVIPEEPLGKLADNFLFLTTSNKDIAFEQRALLEDIAEFLDSGKKGDPATQAFRESVNKAMVYTDIQLAAQLPYTLLLSHVNFNYDRTEKALYSRSPVGLIGLNGKSINKIVNARIVYQLGQYDDEGNRMYDELFVYLEIDEFNWVYFHYQNETVKTYSSYYDEYNYPLETLLEKGNSESGGYHFELASDEDVTRFKQNFSLRFEK